jgi:hypothetical protein
MMPVFMNSLVSSIWSMRLGMQSSFRASSPPYPACSASLSTLRVNPADYSPLPIKFILTVSSFTPIWYDSSPSRLRSSTSSRIVSRSCLQKSDTFSISCFPTGFFSISCESLPRLNLASFSSTLLKSSFSRTCCATLYVNRTLLWSCRSARSQTSIDKSD